MVATKAEVHFFDRPENRDLGLAWYAKQMPEVPPGAVLLEKTPEYAITPGAATNISKVCEVQKLSAKIC